jgi:hypothetical protein
MASLARYQQVVAVAEDQAIDPDLTQVDVTRSTLASLDWSSRVDERLFGASAHEKGAQEECG